MLLLAALAAKAAPYEHKLGFAARPRRCNGGLLEPATLGAHNAHIACNATSTLSNRLQHRQ